MADNGRVELVVTVEVDKANRSIKSVNASFASLESGVNKGSTSASRSLNSFERDATRVSSSVKRQFSDLGRVIAGVGLVALGRKTLLVAADFQRARLGLEAFLGSATAAQRKFAELQDFAERSPFEFSDLLIAANRLLAFKFEADKLIPTLQGVSSAVGALGGDSGKMADLITALGQIRTASHLTGEELRQLRNAGVEGVALDSLAKAYGKSVAEIKRLQREQLIPGLQASNIIIEGLTENFRKFDAAVATSTSVAISNFKDAMMRLSDLVARDLLPGITKFLDGLREDVPVIAQHLRDAIGVMRSFVNQLIALGIAFITYKIVERVRDFTLAIRAFNVASMGTPWGLIAGGLALVGTELYRQNQEWKELKDVDLENNAIRQLLRDGKSAVELEKLGYTVEKVRRALGGDDALGGRPEPIDYGIRIAGISSIGTVPPTLDKPVDIESIEKRASKILDRARRGELDGVARVREEYTQYREELGITAKAREALAKAEAIDVERVTKKIVKDAIDDQKKWAKDLTATLAKEQEERSKNEVEWYERTLKINEERAQLDYERIGNATRQLNEINLNRAEIVRDTAIRQLDAFDVYTVDQKLAVEQRKSEIEIEFINKSHELKMKLFDLDTSRLLIEEELQLKKLGYKAEEVASRIDELIQQRDALRQNAKDQTDAAVEAARQNASIRSVKIVRDANTKMFESLKQQAGGVFDALLRKSSSVWEAIGNSLRVAILTALKDVVTSRIAAAFVQLLTGQSVSFAGGGSTSGRSGGGMFGRFGGLLGLGSVPVFGGGYGGPGSTPPFVPSMSGIGLSSTGGIGQASRISGLAGGAAGLGSLFFNSGSIITGSGAATTAAGIGGVGGALAGIATSPAAVIGGGLLVADGLRRGGLTGLAETTAGGALIGFKFGGPLGAAIGAGIGAIAGTIRLFVKGAQEKAREKIKATYGVDISDKSVLSTVIGLAKQTYGGNLDMAIRAPQIQEIIQLYAMSTGQNMSGVPTQVTPLSLVQSGGTLFQLPSYSNGSPTFGNVARTSAPSGAQPVVIQLDGPATTALLNGVAANAIAHNPRVVQEAVINASRANAGRRELTSLQLSPGTLTS